MNNYDNSFLRQTIYPIQGSIVIYPERELDNLLEDLGRLERRNACEIYDSDDLSEDSARLERRNACEQNFAQGSTKSQKDKVEPAHKA